ncbi:RagB/SusD family nutrient uptake outer membrane protein [Segatella albensis]|uniref:RagB/SusD family nutrient uptake outer membrane protein n=1 Tax=Segatella albensis TaxID=77768 RepID=UPI001EE2D0D5|nr:RagB/SusD family nutrient uptake outer membrane protein [Segatella albensis]
MENEWFKETVGEGLRMSCLKRWGKGFDGRAAQPFAAKYGAALTDDPKSSVHVYDLKKLSADDYHWVWPIPAHEFRLNDNLKQNKGYDEN